MELNGMASFPGLVVCGGARALSSRTVTIGKHRNHLGSSRKQIEGRKVPLHQFSQNYRQLFQKIA